MIAGSNVARTFLYQKCCLIAGESGILFARILKTIDQSSLNVCGSEMFYLVKEKIFFISFELFILFTTNAVSCISL